jgi:ribosomal protein S18 acetylase RimI-like enzyme
MRLLMERLAGAGAAGMHLQVSPSNDGALAFYRTLGFSQLEDPTLPEHTVFMVVKF